MHDPLPVPHPAPPHETAVPAAERRSQSTGDRLIRWGAALSVLVVTTIAAVISYGHAYRLVTRYGESGATAQALPITVDGLVATCSLVILHYTRKNRRAPWHAWGLLITGVCATVGANVSNGLGHGTIGAIVAGWPALVAVGSFELLIRLLRDSKPSGDQAPAVRSEQQKHLPMEPAGEAFAELLPETADPGIGASTQPQEHSLAPAAPPEPEVLIAQDLYANDLARGRTPSIRRLKRDMGIGHPKAARIHNALSQPIRTSTHP